jgi:hypothetical protein
VKYDKVLDLLEYRCETCQHMWSEYPADRLKAKLSAGKTYVENPAPDAAAPMVPSGICGTAFVTR